MRGLLLDGENGMLKSPSLIVEGVMFYRNSENSSMNGTSEGEGGL